MQILRHGNWPSPLTPDALAQGNVRLGFPQFDDAGALYWCELRSAEQGRTTIVRRSRDGVSVDLLPPPWSARTRVHEYGGASYLVRNGELVFVHQADQQLWQLSLEPTRADAPRALTHAPSVRFAEPISDAARGRLIAVAEDHTAGPRNTLVAVSLADGVLSTLASGRDFYAAPAVSPDGRELAFLAWDHPNMPWDAAEVWVARLAADGGLANLRHIAGDARASAFQPTWSPAGVLHFSLEPAGFWNLHRWIGDRVELVAEQAAELGAPLWQLGTRLFAFESDNSVIGACFEQGVSRLVRIDLGAGRVAALSARFEHIGQIALGAGQLACVLGWAGSGSQIARIDLARIEELSAGATPRSARGIAPPAHATTAVELVRDVHAGWLDAAATSQPEMLSFRTSQGDVAHGVFYAAKNPQIQAPAGDVPPLIVLVHGGPTACTAPVFSPAIQFWTTRGFAVLDVNYRGSTGYGRAYRDRLRGQWGVLDVDDCVAGAAFLAAQGRVDPERLVIRGGSAGGYTVLRALSEHEVFAAGSCHYGISDLEALTRDTHKFESHYDRFLIGPYPERRDLFIERSPIHAIERVARPVVFFQGLEDKVVPANQTERMATTLRERGVDTEYHAYPGEQHGFRNADTIRNVLETELAFLRRVLALSA